MYTEHVYTECTAEHWAEKEVSDGGPRSLYKHLPASGRTNNPKTASAVYCAAINMYSLQNIWAEKMGAQVLTKML